MLARALQEIEEMQVQHSFGLLCLDRADHAVAPAHSASHRRGIAAEAIHAREVRLDAVRAPRAHLEAVQRREQEPSKDDEGMDAAQRVTCCDEPAQVIFGELNDGMVPIRRAWLQRRRLVAQVLLERKGVVHLAVVGRVIASSTVQMDRQA